jgi:hypothetical protein
LGILYPQAYPVTKCGNSDASSIPYPLTPRALPLPDFDGLPQPCRPKALFIVPPQYEIDLVGTDIRPTNWTARSISSSRRMRREGAYRRVIQAGALYTAGCTKLAVDTAIVKPPGVRRGLIPLCGFARSSRAICKFDFCKNSKLRFVRISTTRNLDFEDFQKLQNDRAAIIARSAETVGPKTYFLASLASGRLMAPIPFACRPFTASDSSCT